MTLTSENMNISWTPEELTGPSRAVLNLNLSL